MRARRAGERLRLEVENDGPPWDGEIHASPGNGPGNGVGLANVRARLGRLYGAAWRLELSPGGDGGTLAILEIPWRSAR